MDIINKINKLDKPMTDLFGLYHWSTPQRLFVYTELNKRTQERNITDLKSTLETAQRHDESLAELEHEWAGQDRNAVWGETIKKASAEVDTTVTDLNTMLTLVVRQAKEGSPLHRDLKAVKKQMFPKDLGHIVNDSYVGKLTKLHIISKVAQAAPWLWDHRLDVELDAFMEKYETFRDRMRARNWGMSYETIKKGRTEGHRRLCVTISHIISLFSAEDGADGDLREYLLAPIFEQNEIVRRSLKGRTKRNDNAQGNGNGAANGEPTANQSAQAKGAVKKPSGTETGSAKKTPSGTETGSAKKAKTPSGTETGSAKKAKVPLGTETGSAKTETSPSASQNAASPSGTETGSAKADQTASAQTENHPEGTKANAPANEDRANAGKDRNEAA